MTTNKNKLPTIIIPFTLPWDWSADYQRRTIIELSKKNYYVIAYMSNKAHFFLRSNTESYPQIQNVSFYIPKYYIPFRRIKIIDKINKYLSLCLFSLSIFYRKKIIWIFDPIFDYFATYFLRKVSIYDCVDYHDRKHTQQEKKLILNSDYFFVNSNSLFLVHKKIRKATKKVVQGFNLRDFEQKIQKNDKNKKIKKTTIGFIGGINHRLDFKILIPLISNNPQWNFEFWGPMQKSEHEDKMYNTWQNISEIKKLHNVSFNQTNDKKKLINVIKSFDVCLIPYDISQEFNLNCYPMKVFEYFYLGKPVISTPILELKHNTFKNLIYIANTSRDFELSIKDILKRGWPEKKQKKQKELAKKNSWENKVATILDTVHNA